MGDPNTLETGPMQSRIGTLRYQVGYPTTETVQRLYDELDFQRACQAYIWGIPALGFHQLRKAQRENFATPDGALCLYLDFADKAGMLTPNITTAYGFAFWNMAEQGPLVIEVPSVPTAGGVGDIWQRPVSDTGQTGPDAGKGGKYLILPPGVTPPTAAETAGYFVAQSPTNQLWFATRGLDPDPDAAIAALHAHKLYAWDERENPPDLVVTSVNGRAWANAQPADITYFAGLSEILAPEPVDERDRFFLAMLRPLGIIPGQPFAPDERQTQILQDAAVVGHAMSQTIDVANRLPGAHVVPDAYWEYALQVNIDQRGDGYEQLDERTAWFYEAIANSVGMQGKIVGQGQVYLGIKQDAAGDYLDGGETYTLTVPANPPVAQFWSMTAYDIATRGPVLAETQRPDVSSRQDLYVNPDGSTTITFGPEAPDGHTANWIQTVPGRGWFGYFRFYGPTQPYFDKTWSLPDLTKRPA